jgi:hypothetical protein
MCGCGKKSVSPFQGVVSPTSGITYVSTTSSNMVNVVFSPELVNMLVQVPTLYRHLIPTNWLTPNGHMLIKSQTVELDSRLVNYLNTQGINTSWTA